MQEPPLPPWIFYEDEDPFWAGWRQGESATWLCGTWLPFWRALRADEREEYLLRWPPPDEDWYVYMTVNWV